MAAWAISRLGTSQMFARSISQIVFITVSSDKLCCRRRYKGARGCNPSLHPENWMLLGNRQARLPLKRQVVGTRPAKRKIFFVERLEGECSGKGRVIKYGGASFSLGLR